jgi:hypothetical protein
MPVGERGLLEPGELWPQEQQLCAKATEGGLLDLRCRRPEEDDPARGRWWGPQRRIRAQVLFQLLTGHGPKLAETVVAVRLRGAQIVGRLNLGGWTLRCPLENPWPLPWAASKDENLGGVGRARSRLVCVNPS